MDAQHSTDSAKKTLPEASRSRQIKWELFTTAPHVMQSNNKCKPNRRNTEAGISKRNQAGLKKTKTGITI